MSYFPIVSGPVPAYANVAIQPQFYQPWRFEISDITKGATTIVETSEDQNYVVGQQVRFIIPPSFGIIQLNEMTGYVIEILSSNEVVVDIDSRLMDSYIASDATTVVAQILAIGDINQGDTNTLGRNNTITYIPGSFINISPK